MFARELSDGLASPLLGINFCGPLLSANLAGRLLEAAHPPAEIAANATSKKRLRFLRRTLILDGIGLTAKPLRWLDSAAKST